MTPIPFTKPDGELAVEFFTTAIGQLAAAGLPDRLLEDELGAFPDHGWRTAAEAGWFRALLSEDRDGLGLGCVELGAIFRAVGHRLLRGPLLDHAVALPMLCEAVTEAQRAELEPGLDGERIIVVVEPLAAPYGDPADMTVDGRSLSGSADLVRFGAEADSFVVVARRDGDPVILLVPASVAEVQSVPSQDPTTALATVSFAATAVAPAQILAFGADAAAVLASVHGVQRLMAVAELTGVAEEMTALSVDYAKERVQFGRPIAGFQAIRHMLATMTGKSSALLSLSDAVLADADAAPERIPVLGRLAKAYSAEPSRFVAEQALQVHGGVGFTWELTLHLYLRRVLSLEGLLGEDSQLFAEIGAKALEMG
jgi:alkylation response protein AidB-like acyl-CoA dehydrogenase